MTYHEIEDKEMSERKGTIVIIIITAIAIVILGSAIVGYTAYLQSKGIPAFSQTNEEGK